jgi:protein TonB
MARRKTLVAASIIGHVALFTGVFVHNAWDLDRLDYEARKNLTLGAMVPAASEGGAPDLPKPKDMQRKEPPKVAVKETRQPRKPDDRKITIEPPGGGETTGGGRIGPPGEFDGPCKPEDGNCAPIPPVVPPPPELPKPPEVRVEPPRPVPPQILKGLRTSGETAIHPPRDVFNQMFRDRNHKTSAILKVCISTTGSISLVAVHKSTGYATYDDALVSAARRWTYKPYTADGKPMPVCSVVTFLYQMQ